VIGDQNKAMDCQVDEKAEKDAKAENKEHSPPHGLKMAKTRFKSILEYSSSVGRIGAIEIVHSAS
jgi:hypothetical protein